MGPCIGFRSAAFQAASASYAPGAPNTRLEREHSRVKKVAYAGVECVRRADLRAGLMYEVVSLA